MIYFHCINGKLPSVKKIVKGKPHLERLLKDKPYLKKGNSEAMEIISN